MDAPSALLPPTRTGSAVRLLLIALLLGGLTHPAQAQYDPFHTPVIDSILAAEDSVAAAEKAEKAPDTSDDDQHAILRGLNALDNVLPPQLMFALIILGFIVLPAASAVGFAAVALFSESGCLRVLLSIMGWVTALIGGLITGGMMGSLLDGGWAFFMWTGVIACGIGYPILYVRTRKRIKQLPRQEYLTWKHTLTGGALVGTGTASAMNLGRAAGALFKGGGGSFGGGGASGAFSGGQVAQVTAASAQGASAPSAVVLTPTTVSVAAGAVTAGVASADAASTGTDAAGNEEDATPGDFRIRRWVQSALDYARRLRWYHGVGFLLVLLVFLPVGMGLAAVLESPRILLWIAIAFTMLRGSWLLARLAPGFFGVLPLIALFLTLPAAGFVAESQIPNRYLVITVAIAMVVEIGYHVLPNNLPETKPQPDQEPPFRGGSATERW